ncbi:MAG: hypothetical protein ACREFL_13240 [Stellaceae bacterium]
MTGKQMSPLHRLESLTATEAIHVHDYMQLAFGDNARLSIYNDTSIMPASKELDDLVGQIVVAVSENSDSIEIRFLNATKLIIDLRPDAFRGPEALQLQFPGEPAIVWK